MINKTLAIVAIVEVLGLLGLVAVEAIGVQPASAKGCGNVTPDLGGHQTGFSASEGRCFGHGPP